MLLDQKLMLTLQETPGPMKRKDCICYIPMNLGLKISESPILNIFVLFVPLYMTMFSCTSLYIDMTEKEDILKVTKDTNCKHRLYELQRLQHLARRAEIAEFRWHVNSALCSDFEKLKGKKLSIQKDVIATAQAILSKYVVGECLWDDFTADIPWKSHLMLNHIAELNLPPLNPN